MAFDSNANDLPHTFAPTPQSPGATGPYAPLPPSRRQRDVNVQWVAVLAAIVVTVVAVALVLGARPSRTQDPAPRAPSYSEQTCSYRYLSCDDGTTSRWPR